MFKPCSALYLYVVKKTYYLWLCALLMILSACERTEEINLEAPQNKFILCKGSSLYLNNGQKWTANKETTIGISKMQEQMGRFSGGDSVEAYHALGNNLMADYIYIVNYCAEMGNNHEMVHAYLNPMQELIVPLQISSLEVCKQQVNKIAAHLALYQVYFE